MKKARPEQRLDRILDVLGAELAAATDEEVLAAADDLGMKPEMKGTVAFLGLKKLIVPYRPERDSGLPSESGGDESGYWPR